jgi:adenylate kinase
MTVVCVTGTPGTGKTESAKLLASKLGWVYVSLNDIAENKGLYSGYDDERDCRIVDEKKVGAELDKIAEMHNVIAESHYSHVMECDWVIVLRTKPVELRERLKVRGWKSKKIEENVLAEIMEVCKSEAMESATGKTADKVADQILAELKKRHVGT